MSTNFYRIKDIAEITGIHPQTLRNWEKEGLISPLRVSGKHRLYTDNDIQKVLQIQSLKEQGLRIKGIQNVLSGNVFKMKEKTLKPKVANLSIKEQPADQGQIKHREILERPKQASRRAVNSSGNYSYDDLRDMSINELVQIAKDRGVRYFRQMLKDELIIALAFPNRAEEMSELARERTVQRYGERKTQETANTTQRNRPAEPQPVVSQPVAPQPVGAKPVKKQTQNISIPVNPSYKKIEDLLKTGMTAEQVAKVLINRNN